MRLSRLHINGFKSFPDRAELGFDETVIGRVLNHAKHTITSRHYNTHAYLDEIRQALTAWDADLQRVLADEPKRAKRVLPMRRRS